MLTKQNRYLQLISLLCLILLAAIGQAQTSNNDQSQSGSASPAAIGNPGSGTILNIKVLVSNNIDETLGSSSMTKLPAPTWTYHKISSTSTLRISYQESVTHRGLEEGACQWQIRVDDQQSLHPKCDPLSPSVYCLYFNAPLILASNVTSLSLSSSGLFRGLAAGDHEISIYQRNVQATRCIRNSGGFTTTVTVEEIELP